MFFDCSAIRGKIAGRWQHATGRDSGTEVQDDKYGAWDCCSKVDVKYQYVALREKYACNIRSSKHVNTLLSIGS